MRSSIPLIFIILFFISFILFLTPKNSFAPGLVGLFQKVFSSPRAWLYSSSVGGVPDGDSLKKENSTLKEKLLDLENIKRDNIALRSQFQDSPVAPQNLLPVRIIGFSGDPGYPTAFTIDHGLKSGVKKDMTVIIGKNFVGKIENASENYSRILLPTSPSFSMLVQGVDNNASGILTGVGDKILLNNVPITDSIKKGEMITTKGEIDPAGDGVSPGYLIGTVTRVDKSESRPFQSGIVEPSVAYARLRLVFVILR